MKVTEKSLAPLAEKTKDIGFAILSGGEEEGEIRVAAGCEAVGA
jgi:hypothetical protein